MNHQPASIAVLGATGYIAMGLVRGFCLSGASRLYLFARSPDRVRDFVIRLQGESKTEICSFDRFSEFNYDAVINCIGVGDPVKLKVMSGKILTVTENYDNMIIDYLMQRPDTLYINFSSGAVYGLDFSTPVEEESRAWIDMNRLCSGSYYQAAKIYSEVKHRSLDHLRIVDLRIFSYFSRDIDLDAGFFMSELVAALKKGSVFITSPWEMLRDYVHPSDLLQLVEKCIAAGDLNDVFDVYSRKPVSKFELLEAFHSRYGLKFEIGGSCVTNTVTGLKKHYYSQNRRAGRIGYEPLYSSLDGIMEEVKFILE